MRLSEMSDGQLADLLDLVLANDNARTKTRRDLGYMMQALVRGAKVPMVFGEPFTDEEIRQLFGYSGNFMANLYIEAAKRYRRL